MPQNNIVTIPDWFAAVAVKKLPNANSTTILPSNGVCGLLKYLFLNISDAMNPNPKPIPCQFKIKFKIQPNRFTIDNMKILRNDTMVNKIEAIRKSSLIILAKDSYKTMATASFKIASPNINVYKSISAPNR